MKLSDAMDLGFTLVTFDPHLWLSDDGSCGCAFGGALVACGASKEFRQDYDAAWLNYLAGNGLYRVEELPVVRRLWPWLTKEHLDNISDLAYGVEDEGTREALLAYVRSVEPSIFELPDISLEEQHRLEEEAAQVEGELTEASGYPDPVCERNGR